MRAQDAERPRLETAIIATIYFRLLVRFDESILFWILLMAGVGVIWF
jgi:hypothetical protein